MSDPQLTSLPRHEVALVIAGSAYLGWTAVSIDRGIDSLVGSFSLELTSREATGAAEFPIAPGDACQIVLGGKVLITGYIDRRSRALSADNRSLRVSGRDKACDLVDCSALNKPGSWRNVSLAQIARELAAPFGVTIAVSGDSSKPIPRFALQQGETAWAAIERLARYRGLIAFSDGAGGVKIGNPAIGHDSGARTGQIREGNNLVSIEQEDDQSEQFSNYVVKGQASGNDQHNGKAVAQIKGEARDAGVIRYRPLLIIGEEQSDKASLVKRAAWEAKVRKGRASTITAVVPGWFAGSGSASGPVWEPGAHASCDVPSHGLSGDQLIERVRLIRDADGTRTELTLVPPEAWAQLADAGALGS